MQPLIDPAKPWGHPTLSPRLDHAHQLFNHRNVQQHSIQHRIVFVSEKTKKAARSKPIQISIVVMNDKERGVPRGYYKQQLLHEHRVVKTEIYRSMNSDQVKSTIFKAITHLNVAEFIVLECVNGEKLVEAEVGVSGGGARTLLRTSQLPFVGARLV